MKQDQTNQVPLNEFALVASEYCGFIESLSDDRPQNFYTQLELLLARLHISILTVLADPDLPVLSDPDAPETEPAGSVQKGLKQWETVSQQVAKVTNEQTNRLYDWHIDSWNTKDPVDNYCAIRASMLWDDLADIYGELKNGLMLWSINTNESKSEASWKWRFGFESHWGTHLARAMQTVHEARYHLYAN